MPRFMPYDFEVLGSLPNLPVSYHLFSYFLPSVCLVYLAIIIEFWKWRNWKDESSQRVIANISLLVSNKLACSAWASFSCLLFYFIEPVNGKRVIFFVKKSEMKRNYWFKQLNGILVVMFRVIWKKRTWPVYSLPGLVWAFKICLPRVHRDL